MLYSSRARHPEEKLSELKTFNEDLDGRCAAHPPGFLGVAASCSSATPLREPLPSARAPSKEKRKTRLRLCEAVREAAELLREEQEGTAGRKKNDAPG